MQNKHKIWLIVGVVIIALVGVVGFNNQTPTVKITDPNSTDSGTDPVTYTINTIMGKSNGNQSPQQTTPPITQPTPMKQCTKCAGTGEITCPSCNGVFKWKECPNCHDIVPYPSAYTGCGCTLKNFGYMTNYVVKTCECGDGKITCPKCKGAKQVPA